MHCHACNAALDLATGERIAFSDACDRCGADLHVCRNCEYHDPQAYNECRESSAERVGDRERRNRCEYFSPGDQTGGAAEQAKRAALGELDSLFKK